VPSVCLEIHLLSEEQRISSDLFIWVGMRCKDICLVLVFSNDFFFVLNVRVCTGVWDRDVQC